MKLRIKRTGGVAGITRVWETEDKKILGKLALSEFKPKKNQAPKMRDAFIYEITLSDGKKVRKVIYHEPHVPPFVGECLRCATGEKKK